MKTIIPATALFVILQSWSGVLHLVSAFWYERQLGKYANHWLVQLEQVLDLRPLEQACAGYHKGSGKGSAVIHAVPKLVRALLVKYLYNLSYRQSEEQVDCHFLCRWFVGYSLFETVFDHTTLCRFELWVLKHQHRFFFDETLGQIDAHYPAERQQQQLVDTFAMLARGAKTSLITLLRRLSAKLLADLEELDPQRFEALLAVLDPEALFGKEGEKITPALSVAEREERLQQIVRQVWRLYHWLQDSLAQEPRLSPDRQAPLRQWLSYLDKIMADELTLTWVTPEPDPPSDAPLEGEAPDETNAPAEKEAPGQTAPTLPLPAPFLVVRELTGKKKGTYRIVSYNDFEATYRLHHHDQGAILGYNAAIISTASTG